MKIVKTHFCFFAFFLFIYHFVLNATLCFFFASLCSLLPFVSAVSGLLLWACFLSVFRRNSLFLSASSSNWRLICRCGGLCRSGLSITAKLLNRSDFGSQVHSWTHSVNYRKEQSTMCTFLFLLKKCFFLHTVHLAEKSTL